ncbi:MAG: class I SAM-dependent methyltransferase [Bacteroidales bacterium]|nr:class I SAM-dependent methyltransferase [Bacteroidales bacterium]
MAQTVHNISIESPAGWKDYEILDSGNGYKLERFGGFIMSRPEPKALWSKSMSDAEWKKLAHTVFHPGAGFGKAGKEDVGTWEMLKKMPERWFIEYKGADRRASEWSAFRHGIPEVRGLYMKMRLGLTSFKHVGVFPEQASNWDWIYNHTQMLGDKPKVLNLFAYTGGATLAAKCAGAEATHVDSVKQVVNWAKENMTSSGLDNIRWIVDDALKFVKREIRRGNTYNGLILDPPAYGHGPDGERWKLDELLFEMLEECSKIVAKEHSFVVLNLYSNGYSALLADTLLKKAFGESEGREYTCGELVLEDKFKKVIPLSVFARMFTK